MKSFVLGFSGKIGTGKTAVSECVAQQLGFPRVSFGNYVRSIAQRRGLENSRETLQDIGESLVENDCQHFCWSVLNQIDWIPGQNLVVDGIRHLKVLNEIRKIVLPSELSLIYIQVDEAIRFSRLKNRPSDDLDHLAQIEKHSTEEQIKNLLHERADLVVNGNCELNRIIEVILKWVREKKGFDDVRRH